MHHMLPFLISSTFTIQSFESIHIDTQGPYKSSTYDGFKYYFSIINDFTRITWTHLLMTKDSAFDVLNHLLSWLIHSFK